MKQIIKHSTVLKSLQNCVKYNFIPPSCYNIQTKVNPVLAVTLGTTTQDLYTLNFRLFDHIVPKTSENYRQLLLGIGKSQGRQLSLIGTSVNRIINNALIQFGSKQNNYSIFGSNFKDESFEALHNRPGLLTSISQQNTNNNKFAITLAPCPFLDYQYVVFGQVVSQHLFILKKLEKIGNQIHRLKINKVQEIQRARYDFQKYRSHDQHH